MLMLQKSGQLSFFPVHRKARLCTEFHQPYCSFNMTLRCMTLDKCSLSNRVYVCGEGRGGRGVEEGGEWGGGWERGGEGGGGGGGGRGGGRGGRKGVTKYGKFSHFDKIIWFSQIVIRYPDKYPGDISDQEIRLVQPNGPMNTG